MSDYYENQSFKQYEFRPDGVLKNPTVLGLEDFNAERLATQLQKACTNKDAESRKSVCRIISKCSTSQRILLADEYKALFGEVNSNLIEAIKKVVTGDLENLINAMLKPREDYCTDILQKAMEGVGTNEALLIDLLTMQTNSEMKSIRDKYEKKEAITGETSGALRKILIALIQGRRDEIPSSDLIKAYYMGSIEHLLDHNKAKKQAQELLEASQKSKGIEETVFLKILARQSHFQIPLICDAFRQISTKNLEDVIKKEFSGHPMKALLSILEYLEYPQKAYARLIQKATEGMGTNKDLLNYVIVTRSEVDLRDVNTEFHKLTGQELQEFLSKDTKGPYKNLLDVLIGYKKDYEEY